MPISAFRPRPHAPHFSCLVAGLTLAGACAPRGGTPPKAALPGSMPAAAAEAGGAAVATSGAPIRAKADIAPLGASAVHGTLSLVQLADGGVQIVGAIYNLPPNSLHGFHVHEHGDCSSPDGASAGGHFNPSDVDHGHPADHRAHAGDLGNIRSDAQGVARIDLIKPHVSLAAGETTFIGHSFIVHERADDLQTQPTGGAGDRIGCGVIVVQ